MKGIYEWLMARVVVVVLPRLVVAALAAVIAALLSAGLISGELADALQHVLAEAGL